MAEQPDMQELQLALESEVCGLTKEELLKVAKHVDVDIEGLRKLQISKRIRDKIEGDIEKAEDKIAYLQKLNQVVSSIVSSISFLKEQNKNNQFHKGTYACHLSPRESETVARLVGKKCTVKCLLDGVASTAFWDTGAQVSIVSHDWVLKNTCN